MSSQSALCPFTRYSIKLKMQAT